ncbi:hypothetical protein V492_08214 [Pseudogymnoascus sp. VKM F-4246]|nr:hypothetical protein V492_08214 [Pseudogymnoascus sp. VKM F-4246]
MARQGRRALQQAPRSPTPIRTPTPPLSVESDRYHRATVLYGNVPSPPATRDDSSGTTSAAAHAAGGTLNCTYNAVAPALPPLHPTSAPTV